MIIEHEKYQTVGGATVGPLRRNRSNGFFFGPDKDIEWSPNGSAWGAGGVRLKNCDILFEKKEKVQYESSMERFLLILFAVFIPLDILTFYLIGLRFIPGDTALSTILGGILFSNLIPFLGMFACSAPALYIASFVAMFFDSAPKK